MDKGIIKIFKEPHKWNAYKIVSSNPMFETDELIVHIENDRIEFSRPTIDYQGPLYRPSSYGGSKNSLRISVSDDRLIQGTFKIDDEVSDEDIVVIYLLITEDHFKGTFIFPDDLDYIGEKVSLKFYDMIDKRLAAKKAKKATKTELVNAE